MRKYRGLTKDGKWVYGSLIKTEKHTYIWEPHNKQHGHAITKISYKLELYPTYEVLPETVGQFTGRHDKNDKEIWDDDIFKGMHDFGPGGFAERIGTVKFDEEKGYQWNYWDLETIEVIGDIHTTPDLMEKGK